MTEDESTYESRKSTLYKVLKTGFLVGVWICLGLYLEITGPTLVDLRLQTNENYEHISFAISGRSWGFFLGSVLGGLIVDRFGLFCELMVAVCLDGGALVTAFIPFMPSYWLIWVLCIGQGTFEGIINIAGQKLILQMWLEKSASPLHLLHSGFGIGSFIIPQIANPFLAVKVTGLNETAIDTATMHALNFTTTQSPSSTLEPVYEGSRIVYPYVIAAAITASLSFVFYAYHLFGGAARDEQRKALQDSQKPDAVPFRQMFNPASCAGGRFCYGLQIFALVSLYFFIIVGGERVAGKFIRVYSIDELGFTGDDGSYINTIFWISYALGRLSGFVVAVWVPIRILILIETGGLLASSILLAIFGGSTTGFWILMQAFGFFMAPLFPSGIGWTDFHISMTGVGITTLLLGGSLGGVAFMNMMGNLYDHYGPRSYRYSLVGYGIAAFVVCVLMSLVGSQHGSRFSQKKAEEVETDTELQGIDGPYETE